MADGELSIVGNLTGNEQVLLSSPGSVQNVCTTTQIARLVQGNGTGSVQSVGVTTSSLSVSGSPITTSGNISVNLPSISNSTVLGNFGGSTNTASSVTLIAGTNVTFQPGAANLTISAASASGITSVNSLASLRALNLAGISVGTVVYVQQYYNGLGKGDGFFELQTGNITDNGGLLISSSVAGKYWSRILGTGPLQPEMFGAVGGNVAASTQYANLTAIKAVYPFATATTNQLDWLGIQATLNYLYTGQGGNSTTNLTAGAIQFGPEYFIDQPVVCNTQSIALLGVNPGLSSRLANSTSSWTYIGAPGNIDVHTTMLTCTNPANASETPNAKYYISSISFNNGIGGDMHGNQSSSNYVDAIHLGASQGCRITNCNFLGTMNDSILQYAASQFLEIDHNYFYGVQRDAISIPPISGSYSTTAKIHDNNFGWVGRYDYFIFGGAEADVDIRNNYHQGTDASIYYPQHPNWWVSGLVAAGFISASGLNMDNESFESVSSTTGYWADLHLARISENYIQHTTLKSLACTTFGPTVGNGTTPGLTQAGTNYLNTNGWLDLTDTRNFNIGTTSSFFSGSDGQNLTLKNIPGLTNIFTAGGFSDSFGGGIQPFVTGNVFEDCSPFLFNIPTFAGSFIQQVNPIGNASVSPYDFSKIYFTARNFTPQTGIVTGFPSTLGYFDSRNLSGSTHQESPSACTNAWVGNTTVSTTITLGNVQPFVRPTLANENGYYYQYTGAGTSGVSEPTWASHVTPGGTFSDGTATLTCIGKINFTSDISTGNSTVWQNSQRVIVSAASVAPTLGWYNHGDRAYAANPSSGFNGNVCTSSGNPGTWTSF